MGTRADFYVGRGAEAEWLGSIAWDGYRDGIEPELLRATDEAEYREEVARFLRKRDDATTPDKGWPWPWNDSGTSDCSYWFFDGAVHDVTCGTYHGVEGDFFTPVDRGVPFFDEDFSDPNAAAALYFANKTRVTYPDMSARKAVTLGKRSGVIVIRA